MIRLAKTEDLNNITDVYSYARKFMAETEIRHSGEQTILPNS